MKLIMFPLLFSLACIAYQNRDKIADQYSAAYPADPVKSAALAGCAARDHNFNRLDPDDRKYCYRAAFGGDRTITELPPSPAPYYADSPSHLPGNDIRRAEANEGYELAVIRKAAAATTIPVQPVFRTVTAPMAVRHVMTPVHHVAVHHVTSQVD